MKKLYIKNENGERFLLTISSAAAREDFAETLTAETGGACIGPADDAEVEAAYVAEHWGLLESMTPEEEDERIRHLADEWGLTEEELDYLR